jgi:hypothetical protein
LSGPGAPPASDGFSVHDCAPEATRTRGRFSLLQGFETVLKAPGKMKGKAAESKKQVAK